MPSGYKFDPVILNDKLPLEFFEARNALRIAQSAGAERYASTSYDKAVHQMNEADALTTGKHGNKKSLISLSREVVQTSEDAREIAVKHIDEERAESERAAGPGREAREKARTSEESQRRANPEPTPKPLPPMPFASAMTPTARISMRKPPLDRPLPPKLTPK